MVFTGFKGLEYPEYEVITPQTKQSFHVRSLNVANEEKLKASLVTPQKIVEHLNTCIFESIVKKPAAIKTYDDFLKATTLKDRDALLYGLYHISYGDIRDYDVSCSLPTCRKTFPITVKASDTFSINAFPDKNVVSKEIKVDLPVSKGVVAFVKQPTLADELEANNQLGTRPGATPELITEILLISRFEHTAESSTKPTVYSERTEILDAYLTLPAKDKRSIYETYKNEFGQYGIELKMRAVCSHCGNEEVIDIDLVSAFFQVLYGV